MKTWILSLFILGCSSLALAGDGSVCDVLFSYRSVSTPQKIDDATGHINLGYHEVILQGRGSGTYSGDTGVCKVSCAASPAIAGTDYGTVTPVGYKHSFAGNGTYPIADGVSPQTAHMYMIGGMVSCAGGCGAETVLGGPPWTITPDKWLAAWQGDWPNTCPKQAISDQGCIQVHDKSDHGWKCCPPENCTSPIAVAPKETDWSSVFGGPCVWFDIYNSGKPVCMDWPLAGSGVGWLALPDKQGRILNSKQLFGSFSPQGAVRTRISDGLAIPGDGYMALVQHDENDDWKITPADKKVWSRLCVWHDDVKRDGKVQPGECTPLSDYGIHSLSAAADHVKLQDHRNNQGRLAALINDDSTWKSVDWYMQVRKRK